MTKALKILSNYNVNSSKQVSINGVEWLCSKSDEGQILFYHFNKKDEAEIDLFNERIRDAKYFVCITNLNKEELNSEDVYHFADHKYLMLQKELLNEMYPTELDHLSMVGVTGTNGKTTTVYLVEQLCIQSKLNVLTIGSLGVRYNGVNDNTFNFITTPSFIDFNKIMNKYQKQTKIVAVELTSHALVQKRFGSIQFSELAWTNFSQDHLDYHETMEEYFKAKLLVFEMFKEPKKLYVPKSQVRLIGDLPFEVMKVEFDYTLENNFFKVGYNKDNLALALALIKDHINMEKIKLNKIKAPPGRYNVLEHKNSIIVIDFAHTPDGLISICSELKKAYPSKKLTTLFGCGGDRDKTKRPLMGEAVSKYSDMAVLTTDNPRFEDPDEIIKDILPGMNITYHSVTDRVEAIKFAISQLNNSVLLIAGKGDEMYIDVKGVKVPYSDLEEVKKLI